MAEFDLSQLNNQAKTSGAKSSSNSDVINTTNGKINRSGNYITPQQARQMNPRMNAQNNDDEIFTTPPTFKVGQSRDANIQSLQEDSTVVSYGSSRTPINSGSPNNTPVVHSVGPITDVPDPTPIRPVNNLAHKINAGSEELTPFDVNSLPKKRPEVSNAEEEDMAKLDMAIEREKKSITERVRALTEKQYEELMDAQQSGKVITPPMTDEEVAAQEEARVNASNNEEEDAEDTAAVKRFVYADDDTFVEVSNASKLDAIQDVCMKAISYVDLHVTSSDYFTRVMNAKSWLSKQHIYSEIWAIVMYNDKSETAVHPFLVAKKDGVVSIVECNLTNIKGVHTLDPNDTIEGLYVTFLHNGYLYEYIDYLAKTAVVKLPVDMPTIENAIKLANEKIGVENMTENSIPSVSETDNTVTVPATDELDGAIKMDEASALYSGTEDDATDSSYEQTKSDDVDTSNKDEIEHHYTFADSDETTNFDNSTTSDMGTEKEDIEVKETDESTKNSITISKEYDGASAPEYQIVTSDDLAKDLEHELNIDVDTTGRTEEDMLNELKDAVKKNIPAIKNKINLHNFTISDTPISASMVASFSIADINQADWVMPNAQRVITVKGLSGPELFAMNPQNTNKNKINTLRQIYGIIYKHVVSKKPKSFDEWLKVTRFSDLDHIYAALHRATFAGSNFVHYECPECHHVFIKDYDFEEMVHYGDDAAKSKIHKLLNSANASIPDYEIKLTQISDNYVVGLKDPSIWSMAMETAALSDDFLAKYEDLMDTMSFIDSIYVIDRDNNSLKPVDFSYDKNNPAKSTARKIMILSDIIKTLSSDNYFDLRNQIAQMFASSNDVTYQIPGAVCPECGKEIPVEPTEGVRMLFTRHQLGALGVI